MNGPYRDPTANELYGKIKKVERERDATAAQVEDLSANCIRHGETIHQLELQLQTAREALREIDSMPDSVHLHINEVHLPEMCPYCIAHVALKQIGELQNAHTSGDVQTTGGNDG